MKIASKKYEQLTTSALIDLFESTRTLSHSLIPEKLAANVWNYLPKAEKENWIETYYLSVYTRTKAGVSQPPG